MPVALDSRDVRVASKSFDRRGGHVRREPVDQVKSARHVAAGGLDRAAAGELMAVGHHDDLRHRLSAAIRGSRGTRERRSDEREARRRDREPRHVRPTSRPCHRRPSRHTDAALERRPTLAAIRPQEGIDERAVKPAAVVPRPAATVALLKAARHGRARGAADPATVDDGVRAGAPCLSGGCA